MNKKPRVFIYISGGIGCYVSDGDVDVELFDADGSEEDIEKNGKIKKEFTDLAEFFYINKKYIEE